MCSGGVVTFFVPWNPNSNYQWNVLNGGTGVPGSNTAEYIVTWGAVGTGFIQLVIDNQTIVVCVNILPKPTAFFTSPAYACNGTSMWFYNLSTGATSYLWDFGDGNTTILPGPHNHTYTNPGTYTVTLTATNQVTGPDGNILCCCTDVYTLQVVVDELPGPNIYCISTLCEGDSACYNTDATNCGSYVWTVLDALGNDITNTISGQNTNEICLKWGVGPVGTISLLATGCDSTYCNTPTTVQVPIIAAVSNVDGPANVCAGSTHTYCLPKWMGTTYTWTVTGGTIVGPANGHCIAVAWGPAGPGNISATYVSDFLACLPIHEPGDCSGVANLPVTIRPQFSISNMGPSAVCVGQASLITATPAPLGSYTWSINPVNPLNTTTGNGTASFQINWGAPGTYIITAQPTLNTAYCNTSATVVIRVADVPAPAGVTGPTETCPGETQYFTAQPNGSGFGFQWTAVNGTVSPGTGATVAVTWGPTGPYSLSVTQVQPNAPFCQSPPLVYNVSPKGPNGPYTLQAGPSCLNAQQTYNLVPAVPPHPDVVYTWSISNPLLGSVIGGQGTTSATIQWGNTGGSTNVVVTATLCGQSVTTPFAVTLAPTTPATISQTGILCPGSPGATLTASAGYASYQWSNGSFGQSTGISSAGTYSVTVTSPSTGCPATTSFTAVNAPGPIASISSGGGNVMCIQSQTPITMVAQTGPGYSYAWFCTGPLGGPPVQVSTSPSFTHTWVGTTVPGTYTYFVVVTLGSCQSTSLPYFITESDCPGGPGGGCPAEPYTLNCNAVQLAPNCDQFSFSFNASGNFTFTNWFFGDGNISANPSPTHTYANVGCYAVKVCGTVPTTDGTGTCTVCCDLQVCSPIKAAFTWTNPTCNTFNFTHLTNSLPGAGNAPQSFLWTTSDAQSSTSPNPTFTFAPGPPIAVTLTVTNGNGCISTATATVTPNNFGPAVLNLPAAACLNDAFNFSASVPGGTAPVVYNWTFGGSGTYQGPSGQYAFNAPPTSPGVVPVSLSLTDAKGCTAGATGSILVHPPVPPAAITAVPGLVICQGNTTQLIAPTGYSYLWNPGAQSSPSITVGSGQYSVELTDANGCKRVLDQVEVIETPLPQVTVQGNLSICDAGCTTLQALSDPSYSYQWFDDNMIPLAGETGTQLLVCDVGLLPGYHVTVTDLLGCSTTVGPIVVQVAASPSFGVSLSPLPACAGQPTTLNVTPVATGVNYTWNTGAQSPQITVTQAGTYTVIGVDSGTGCSASASGVVNPLPDFCFMPQGCYDICPPKTLCGPAQYTYQWNLNGVPIAAANDSCFTIDQSGLYTVTLTNTFGCTTTSGVLDITILDCGGCDSLSITSHPYINPEGVEDACCVALSYTLSGNVQALNIYAPNAQLALIPGSIDPALNLQSITPNGFVLNSIVPLGNLPQGLLQDFIAFCVQSATASPTVVYIEWLDGANEIICTDSIAIHCITEPDCLYLLDGEITCEEDGSILYTFTVCNPSSQSWSVGYVDIVPLTPTGIVVTPPSIDLSSNPIPPGQCLTLSVTLSGPGNDNSLIEGETFCFTLVGHQLNPMEFPESLCCATDSLYCIDIPICDVCKYVFTEGAIQTPNTCCYQIVLVNNYLPGYFDEIALCMLTQQASFTVTNPNPAASGWFTTGYTGTAVGFVPNPPAGGIGMGVLTLPKICIQTQQSPQQWIEIKWMKDGKVVCRDTLALHCDPPCGYLTNDAVLCEAPGTFLYTGTLYNTSGQTIQGAYVSFTAPAGMNIYNQNLPIPPLATGQSAPISLLLGPPAQAGDVVCFTVILHGFNSQGVLVECCQFEHCIELPDCGNACTCDPEFEAGVLQGFGVEAFNATTFTFTPLWPGFDETCDSFTWDWGNTVELVSWHGTATHTFPGPGIYKVCMRVARITPLGEACEYRVCRRVKVIESIPSAEVAPLTLWPNPAGGVVRVKVYEDATYPLHLRICDATGQTVNSLHIAEKPADGVISIDVSSLTGGAYVLHFDLGGFTVSKKWVKQ